ncbi:polysaccharide lyase-like protein [Actinomycetospora succinea]|uniref:Polysaccharide lyase-like protein n=1 Tax=Actinomycetospora succinea TaxID=663603 RepID=A0A4V3D7T5_9PSEU|nr:polysaccharide lyase-like protein [Actinomycetospora succinea]
MIAAGIVAVLVGLLAPGPALASSPTPPGGDGLIWRADDGGDMLGSFQRNEYNEQDGAPREVSSPSGHGQALEFSLQGGDQRSELLPRVPDGREGDVYYYGYRGRLADDFPVDAQRFQIIMQWHHYGDEGSPPVAIAVQDGRLMITGGDNDRNEAYQQAIAPIRPGDEIDIIVRIVFSRDPEKGTVDVWSGGRRTVTAFHPPDGTLYDDGDYMKVGLYRSEDLSDPASLTLDDVAVGRTRQAVDAAMVDQGASSAQGTPDAGTEESTGSDSSLRTGLAVGTLALIGAVVAVVAVVRRRQRL